MENRKTRMVKRMLKEALIELLNEKKIGSISVRELAERADINRSTFYSHYEDVYQLLDEIAKEAVTHIPFDNGIERVSREKIMEAMQYMEKHRELYIALMKTGVFYEHAERAAIEMFRDGAIFRQDLGPMGEDTYIPLMLFALSGTEKFLLYCLEEDSLSLEKRTEVLYCVNDELRKLVIRLAK